MDSLNPQILPSNLSRKDHRKSSLVALWAAIAAIAIGLIYWGIASKKAVEAPPVTPPTATSTVSADAQTRQAMLDRLNESPSLLTSTDITAMKATLSKRKVTLTEAQKVEMINQLNLRK